MKIFHVVALAAILAAGAVTAPKSYATFFTYDAFLSGLAESPTNASPGTGFAQVDYDDVLHTMRVQVTFSNLLGTTTASHIHAATVVPGTGTAGVATQTPTFSGFPSGVTSGTYDNTFDMTQALSYNPSFVTAHGGTVASAEVFLKSSMDAGEAYLNIHTTNFAGGEIRGFLALVPEPSSVVLAAFGFIGLAAWGWRRKR